MFDRFSGFPFAVRLTSMTIAAVTKELLNVFMDFGFTETIRTDNGPAFRQKFTRFCELDAITHETSSPISHSLTGMRNAGLRFASNRVCK